MAARSSWSMPDWTHGRVRRFRNSHSLERLDEKFSGHAVAAQAVVCVSNDQSRAPCGVRLWSMLDDNVCQCASRQVAARSCCWLLPGALGSNTVDLLIRFIAACGYSTLVTHCPVHFCTRNVRRRLAIAGFFGLVTRSISDAPSSPQPQVQVLPRARVPHRPCARLLGRGTAPGTRPIRPRRGDSTCEGLVRG